MTSVFAITNQKGGVGKTTTSVNLAASLASAGKRVLLIDTDPQGNATTGSGVNKSDVEQSSYDVLVEGTPIHRVRQTSEENGYDIVPANADTTAAEVELLSVSNKEFRLRDAVALVKADYDFIVIDCPPTLNMLTVNALVAATGVIIPLQCEYYALEGISALLDTIERIRQLNPDLKISGILRTMYDARTSLTRDVSEQLRAHFGDAVYRTVIPRNVRLAEAPSHGLAVLHYDRGSKGSLAYLAMAGEVLKRQQAEAA